MKINSMSPVIDGSPNVIILGSMPGKKSLDDQMYYANPRNHFWWILSEFSGDDLTIMPYHERKKHLVRQQIALWDVLEECEREGSLDSAIRNESFNPIHSLLKDYPSIQAIGCNGTKAYQGIRKYEKIYGALNLPVTKLPSTSPVPGKNVLNYTEKCHVWQTFFKTHLKGDHIQ